MSTDKLRQPKKRQRQYGIWRLVYIFALALSATGIVLTLFYIYDNIYSTSQNNAAIVGIRSNISWFNLDLHGYENISDLLEQKGRLKTAALPEKNIFIYNGLNSDTAAYASSTGR